MIFLRKPFFDAEDGAGGGGTPATEEIETRMTFTELLASDKDYQSEFDKLVQKGITTAKSKWEADAKKKAAEEKRLAELSAEQKAEEMLKAANAKVAELEAKNAAILLRQDTVNILAEKGLDTTFADFLISADAEATKTRIEAFEKTFRAAVQSGVDARIKGKAPSTGQTAQMTKEAFLKLSTDEQTKFKNEHPEEFKVFMRGR